MSPEGQFQLLLLMRLRTSSGAACNKHLDVCVNVYAVARLTLLCFGSSKGTNIKQTPIGSRTDSTPLPSCVLEL